MVIWPRMGPVMNLELHKVQVLYWLNEQQLASKRKLFSVELVTTVYMSYKCPPYNLLFVSRGTGVHILAFCVIFCTALSVSSCKSRYWILGIYVMLAAMVKFHTNRFVRDFKHTDSHILAWGEVYEAWYWQNATFSCAVCVYWCANDLNGS